MGMDLRFYRGPITKSATIEFTLIEETRSNELYHAIGSVIGYGHNGSFNPISSGELEMVVEILKDQAVPDKVFVVDGFPYYHRTDCVEPVQIRRLGAPGAGALITREDAEEGCEGEFMPCPLCHPDVRGDRPTGYEEDNKGDIELVKHLIDYLDNEDEDAVIWFEWDN